VKASSLFTVIVALLAGLAVAAIAKVSGIFNRQPPPPPARPEIQVLVPNHNLFEGFVVQSGDVKARALRPDELEHYYKHKDQYLPPVVSAAALRVLRKNLEADQPILRDHLYELSIAEPLHQRLLPSMRAINLTLTKDESAGGLIQVGDWVDVHLTSTIEWGGKSATRTASIARNLRVVAKRNILWKKVLASQPDDKPVYYTLEANAYRAALIEFARDKGRLSLVPVPGAEQQRLQARLRAAQRGGNSILGASFVDADSREYKDEESRIAAILRGDLSIGEGDLVRIFNLQTGPPPLAATKPLTVQMFVGVKHDRNVIFASASERTEVLDPAESRNRSAPSPAATRRETGSPSFEFSAPGANNCKTRRPGR
jgi:Flp pilus assembly protein CpaB